MSDFSSSPVEPNQPVQKQPEKKSNLSSGWGNIAFGLLAILIGALWLFNNLGYLDVSIGELLRLWPLLLIIWGLSFFRGPWFGVLAAVIIVLMLGFAFFVLTIGLSQDTESREITIRTDEQAVNADFSFKLGAIKINLSGGAQDLAVGRFSSNGFSLNSDITLENGTQIVEFAQSGTGAWPFRTNNQLNLNLTNDLPLNLTLQTGASDIALRLSELDLRSLKVSTGASNLSVDLGARAQELDVLVEAGASSITINLPSEAGARVVVASALASKDIVGLNHMGDNVYQSDDYEEAERKINIRLNLGVSSLTIARN